MTSSLHNATPTGSAGDVLWRFAQLVGVTATATLIVGLIALPDVALDVLWNVAIPLLPASFLISPVLWRNVCPLATLNMLPNGLVGRRTLTSKLLPTAGMVGIVLLAVLVPARRFLFNTDGTALAVVVILVLAAALVLGAVFDVKAGFCNAICPVLPVERLYGQQPLVEISNRRCIPCTLCTTKGCIDLAPTKSIAHTLGRARRSHRWLITAYGVFAAAFPGFVVGYYTTQDVPFAAAGAVYLHVAAWAGGSYLLTAIIVRALNVAAALATTALAAAAAALYYWFAAPLLASAFHMPDAGTVAIRFAALTVVAVWLWHAVHRASFKNEERSRAAS